MTKAEIIAHLVALHDDTCTQVMCVDVVATGGGFVVTTEDGNDWFSLAELAAAHILDHA